MDNFKFPSLPSKTVATLAKYDTTVPPTAHFDAYRDMLDAREESIFERAKARYDNRKKGVGFLVEAATQEFSELVTALAAGLKQAMASRASYHDVGARAPEPDDLEEVDFSRARLAIAYFLKGIQAQGFKTTFTLGTEVFDGAFTVRITWGNDNAAEEKKKKKMELPEEWTLQGKADWVDVPQ